MNGIDDVPVYDPGPITHLFREGEDHRGALTALCGFVKQPPHRPPSGDRRMCQQCAAVASFQGARVQS